MADTVDTPGDDEEKDVELIEGPDGEDAAQGPITAFNAAEGPITAFNAVEEDDAADAAAEDDDN